MKRNILQTKKGDAEAGNQQNLKTNKKYSFFQYHFLFLFIGLFFGLKLVFVNPPWQTNDEDRHFYNAYALSKGYISPKIENGKIGYPMPTNLIEEVQSFQGIQFSDKTLISKEKLNDLDDQPLEEKKISFCENASSTILPFAYIPAAVMIKIGSVFKSSPVWLGWWGRIGSLLAYLAVVFFAIKIIPHFKPLLMVIALSPMALYQGASVTYDALSFPFLFFLFALVIKFYFQKTPITLKQVILFCLIALAQRCSKEGYFILYFALFAISINKFESKKVYFLSFLLLLVASFLPSFLWDSYIAGLHLPQGKFQVDYKFDSALNIKYQLQNPLHAVSLLFQNLFSQGKLWISGSIGRFGYSYTLLPDGIIFLQLLVYIAVVLLEKPDKIVSFKFRILFLCFAFLNFFALIAAGLIFLSPVGTNSIFGFQGRYFTPLLPFIFFGLFYLPVFKGKENLLKWVVPVYCIVVLLYTCNFLDSKFYTF